MPRSVEAMSFQERKIASHFWVSAALFAASIDPIIVKLGYMGSCSPWQLLAVKSIVGALLLFLITGRTVLLSGSAFPMAVLPIALLLFCTNTLMILALQYIDAGMMITVMTVTPAAVAVVNQSLGRDILGPRFWSGFAVAALGLILTTGGSLGNFHSAGILMALAAVISSTVYRVLLEKETSIRSPALVSTFIYGINGLCALPILIFCMNRPFSAQSLAFGSILGATAATANLAFLWAISQLGSTRVSIIAMLQRPLIIVVSALVLREAMTALQIAGTAMVFIGISLSRVKRRSEASPISEDEKADLDTASEKTGADGQQSC